MRFACWLDTAKDTHSEYEKNYSLSKSTISQHPHQNVTMLRNVQPQCILVLSVYMGGRQMEERI
jgi:hypothetical protein